jgi:hypothetical protein
MGGRPNNKGPTIKAIILAINTKLDGAFCSSGEVNHAISRAGSARAEMKTFEDRLSE